VKKLKPHRVDWAQIERFLQSAERKLASAHKILAFDEEACLQQAYEAMLKASLGFMFSHGFRARSQPGHHRNYRIRAGAYPQEARRSNHGVRPPSTKEELGSL